MPAGLLLLLLLLPHAGRRLLGPVRHALLRRLRRGPAQDLRQWQPDDVAPLQRWPLGTLAGSQGSLHSAQVSRPSNCRSEKGWTAVAVGCLAERT